MAHDDSTTTRILRNLEKIQAGEDITRSREELFTNAVGRIRGLVAKAMRSRSDLGRWIEPDDLLQEVLIRLDRAIQDARPQTTAAFFLIVAQHIQWETIDLVRRLRGPAVATFRRPLGPSDPSDPNDHVGSVQHPDAQVQQQLDLLRLHEAVDRLDPDARDAWHLHYYLGWTHEETAACLEVSAKTIQRRLADARVKLANDLHDLRPTE